MTRSLHMFKPTEGCQFMRFVAVNAHDSLHHLCISHFMYLTVSALCVELVLSYMYVCAFKFATGIE